MSAKFAGPEILAQGLKSLLEHYLPATIEEVNAEYDDEAALEQVAQVLDHMPTESDTEAGLPVVGIADMTGVYEDDLVASLAGSYQFYVHALVEHSSHGILVKLLRRYVQAINSAIQSDREQGFPYLGRDGSGVWSIKFDYYEPGPMLADRDPGAPDSAPTSWLSWSGVVVSAKREEF